LKVLVLGAGESGKTTFSTQLRLIYDVMSSQDRLEFMSILPLNAMSAMQNLLQGAEKLDIDFGTLKETGENYPSSSRNNPPEQLTRC
jgi:GTPase SAR1 family protein